MKIDTYLYKNKKLVKKHLNLIAEYDKNKQYLAFYEDEDFVEITVDLEYQRTTKEHVFKLKNDSKALVRLLDINQELQLELIKCDRNKTKEKIMISYIIETEPEVLNEIIINIKNS